MKNKKLFSRNKKLEGTGVRRVSSCQLSREVLQAAEYKLVKREMTLQPIIQGHQPTKYNIITRNVPRGRPTDTVHHGSPTEDGRQQVH